MVSLRIKLCSVKEALMELIAETDDEILDKYFSGEELNAQDIQKGLTNRYTKR